MTTPSETIAVLGAGGTMGRPMAANLAHAGFTVRAWNRTPEHAAEAHGDEDMAATVLTSVAGTR